MKCVIVAAGQGIRLRDGVELKPLVKLAGVALIEHVMARGRKAGVDEFVVVGGYKGEELRAALGPIAGRAGVAATYVHNAEWERANGVSLFTARDHLHDPFMLTMCDHLFDPALARGLLDAAVASAGVTLAVDYKIDGDTHDPEDVTRVVCHDNRITAIGKGLPLFNCFDTGVFLCGPAMFAALEQSQAAGDDSISGAMRVLAQQGAAFGHGIGDKLWIDVDDLAAFRAAEIMLETGQL